MIYGALKDMDILENGSLKFTIVITAFNRNDFILEAIDSALSQSLGSHFYEIIVVSNLGLENFAAYQNINKLHNLRLLYLEDGTIGEFLTEGIIHSKGEIISFLDDDDLFFYNKLERVKAVFNKYPSLGYYHNSAHIFRSKVELSNENQISALGGDLDIVSIEDPLKKLIKFIRAGGSFNMSSISVKRSVLISSLDILRNIENDQDLFMLMVALQNGAQVANDEAILTYYRKGTSTSFPVERVGRKVSIKIWLFEKAYRSNLALLNVISNEKLKLIILRNLLKIGTICSFNSNKYLTNNINLKSRFLVRVLLDLDGYYFSIFLISVISKSRIFSKFLKLEWKI